MTGPEQEQAWRAEPDFFPPEHEASKEEWDRWYKKRDDHNRIRREIHEPARLRELERYRWSPGQNPRGGEGGMFLATLVGLLILGALS